MNATTTAPALGTPVMVTIDPRRAARPGVVVSSDKPGTVAVLYTIKGGAERTTQVTPDRVAVATGEEGTAILVELGWTPEEAAEAVAPAEVAEELPAAGTDSDPERDEAGDVTDELAEVVAAAETVEDAPAADVQGPHTRDECEDLDACTADHDAAAPKRTRTARAPKKAALPEGFVTVTELARAIQAAGLHDGGRTGGDLRPSVVNRRIQDARGTEHAFPGTEEHGRLAVQLEVGLAWWRAKNERVAARKAAAAARKAAKAG